MLLWIAEGHAVLAERERRRQCDGADPADVHQQDQHQLGGIRQVCSDAGGQADRREGRDHLEDDPVGSDLGGVQDEHRAQHDDRTAEDQHGDGLALGRMADAPAEGLGVHPAADLGDDQHHQDHRRAHLHATGRAGTAAADEHQEVVQAETLVRQPTDIDRVESGSACRHRREDRRQQLVPCRHRSEGARVRPLEGKQQDRAASQQHGRSHECQLGVHRPMLGVPELVAEVLQHRKAETADHDRQHDGCEEVAVGRVADQAIGVDRKAGVVQGRDGMELAAPGSIGQRQVVTEMQAQRQRQCGHHLDDHGHEEHELGDAADVSDPQGHHPEAADLEQRHDHPLPERRPVGAGVHRHQAGHAHGRHRGEQGRELALVGCGSYARLAGHVGSRHLRCFDEPAILRRTGRQAVRAATAWPARAMTSSSPRPATVRAA